MKTEVERHVKGFRIQELINLSCLWQGQVFEDAAHKCYIVNRKACGESAELCLLLEKPYLAGGLHQMEK